MDLAAGPSARFQFASDQSLIVYFDQPDKKGRAQARPLQNDEKHRSEDRPQQRQVTLQANEKVRKLLRLLESEPLAGVRNLHPAYCSLLIKFDALRMRHEELETIVRKYVERLEEVKLPAPRRLEIPVCYGGEFGPDLAELCSLHGITVTQAIQLHSSVEYLVYFLGFVPGFAYLGDLPNAVLTQRWVARRRKVPAGSVGIAGDQTGVYAVATRGGWRLFGLTIIEVFRVAQEGFSILT